MSDSSLFTPKLHLLLGVHRAKKDELVACILECMEKMNEKGKRKFITLLEDNFAALARTKIQATCETVYIAAAAV